MREKSDSKTKLLNASLYVIRAQGYAATTVEEICQHAGVTKGSFFHHFSSKEELALAAIEHFSKMADGLFAGAPYQQLSDPLARVLGYLDFRRHILQGELPEFTCLLGTLVQETYDSYPTLREACERGISGHAANIEIDLEEARQKYCKDAKWSAKDLALYTQAVLQGSFILAKAQQGPEIAAECISHLQSYIKALFHNPEIFTTTRRDK